MTPVTTPAAMRTAVTGHVDILLFSPCWDLASDSILVAASIRYGRKALAAPAPAALQAVVAP